MPRALAILLLCTGVLLVAAHQAMAEEPAGGSVNLWLPGQTWAVKVQGKAYVVTEREVALGSKAARFFGEDRGRHLLVSGFIEPATREGDASVVRQVLLDSLKRSPLPPKDIATWENDAFAYAQFTSAMAGAPDFRQRSLHVYGVLGQYWIDIHFSTMDAKFDVKSLATTVSVEENYVPTDQDKADAIEPIKRLERQLSAPANSTEAKWKALAVKVAIAYGEAGQVADARRVLQSGLVRHPGYALFYYNLACADAEEGDAEGAMANLRLAWRNRNTLAAGESLPDPLQDSSFAAMAKESRYRQMMAELAQIR